MPASGRNVSASVPVIRVCAGSAASAANKRGAAVGIEVHRRFVEQQQRREAARLGDQRRHGARITPISSAFCSPVLASAAGVPVAASVSAMSVRCAPSAGGAGGGVARAAGGQAVAQPVLHRQRRARLPAARRSGRPGRCGPAGNGRRRRLRAPRSAAPPAPCARPWRPRRGAPSRPPARRARPGPGAPSASRRLRWAMAASCAATSRAWPGSSAQTSRSRKRRRPDRPSWNSRSICGVSQTAATRAAISAWLRGAAPSRRNTRRSGGPSGGVPVPISTSPSAVAKRPATAQPPAPPCRAQVGGARAAQAAAGHQQRDRLQQVGLAAAVRSEQHGDARRRPPGQRGVAAEVGQRQAQQLHAGEMRRGRRRRQWGRSVATMHAQRRVGLLPVIAG